MGNSQSECCAGRTDEEPLDSKDLEEPLGQLDAVTSSQREALFPSTGWAPRVLASAEEQEDCQRNDGAWIETGGQNFNKLPSTGTWCQKLIKPSCVLEATALTVALREGSIKAVTSNGGAWQDPIQVECSVRSRPHPFHLLPSAGTWCQKLHRPAEAAGTCSQEDPVNVECLERSGPRPFYTLPSAGTWCQKLNQPAEAIGVSSPEVGTLSDGGIVQADFVKLTVPEGIRNFDTLPSTGTWCQKRIETQEEEEDQSQNDLNSPISNAGVTCIIGKEQQKENWNRQLSDASTASTSLAQEDPNLAMYQISNTLPSTGTWCQKLLNKSKNADIRPLLASHEPDDLKTSTIPEPVNDGCQLDFVKPTVTGNARNFHTLPSTGTWCQPLTYRAEEPSISDIQDTPDDLFEESEECILEGMLSVYGAPDSGESSTAAPEEISYLDPLGLLAWSSSLLWGGEQK